MSKNQEDYKAELTGIIDGLNNAIEKSTNVLMKKDRNPQNLKTLEHVLSIKQKELATAKSQVKIYRQQFDLLNSKANDKLTMEKYYIN